MKKLETASIYFANKDAINASLLKRISLKSLLHALAEEIEQTPAMLLGSAIHCAILEPERFSIEYAIAPKVDRRTKEGKSTWEAFELANAGKSILTEDQGDTIKGMKESILSHEIASMVLSGGEAEYSYYVKDDETGLQLKARPDYRNGSALIDLKTTSDASFEGFSKAIGGFGYHIQAAFYLDVFNKSQSESYRDFFFVAIENKAPFALAIYRLDENHIEAGRVAYRAALRKYADFLSKGGNRDDLNSLRKFGYPSQITDIQIPYWMLDKIQTA